MAAINVTSGDGDTHTIKQGARAVVRLSNGIPYVIVENSTDDQIQVWKGNATTPASFSEPDVGNGPSGTVWGSCSVCVDVNDVIHISYCTYEGKACQLRYVQFASDAFLNDAQIIADLGEDPGAITALHTAIAIDSNNKPHIAFIAFPKSGATVVHTVKYINNIDAAWNSGVAYEVEGVTNVKQCKHPDISIDKDNKPVISYINVTDYDVGTAIGNQNDAESFTLQDIETNFEAGATQYAVPICVDSSGNHYVAFRDNTTNHLYLRKHTYGVAWDTWVARTTGGDGGRDPSIVANGTDIYIFYEDDFDDVVYEKVTGGSSWQGDVTLETGTYNAVKAKWAYAVDRDSGGTNRGGGSGRVEIDYAFTDETATPDILFNSLILGVAGLSINVHETINTVESLTEGLPLPGISKFESLTLAEFRQMLISLNPSVFKSLTVAEYINLFISGGNTNVFNNITIQEVIAAAIKLTDINKYDQVTINESITILIGVLGLIIESDDTINITEYVKANISIFSNVSDVVNIIESIIIAMKLAGVNKYDQITIQEAITAAINLVGVNKYDQITIQELITSVIKLVGIDKYDQVTIQEAITAAIKLVDIDKYDQVVINETIIMVLGILASVSDTIDIQEVIAATIELLASVSDKIDITEYAKANIPIPANAFDDITIKEIITSAIKLADIGKYDQITIVEATTVAVGILNLTIDSADVVNITEIIMMAIDILNLTITSDEIINITEYVMANIPVKADISDVVNLTEAIIMALPISISVSDTPVIIENIVTAMSLAGVSISESVTLAEYQNLLVDLFSSSHEKLTITEYIMASILAPTAYPLLITLAKSVEYGIDLSKSVEYRIDLSKSVEYGVSLSKVGGGIAT